MKGGHNKKSVRVEFVMSEPEAARRQRQMCIRDRSCPKRRPNW